MSKCTNLRIFFFYPKCGIMTSSHTKEVIIRKDVQALINFYREEAELLNKSEIVHRMNYDRRTVDKYINNLSVRASTR